jgi:hypothetical protein
MVSIIIGILACFIVGGGYTMTERTVYRPGSTLYPLQRFAENQRLHWVFNPVKRAQYLLELADRRLADLQALTGTSGEVAGLSAVDQALQEAINAISNAPSESQTELKSLLDGLIDKTQIVLADLKVAPSMDPQRYAWLKNLIGVLIAQTVGQPAQELASLGDPGIPSDAPSSTEVATQESELDLATPQVVQFLEGSGGAKHDFFPLVGKHSTLECLNCHVEGRYVDTPNLCIDCHAKNRPIAHFELDCVTCHTPEDWSLVNFDHSAVDVSNCEGCHQANRPANHFPGQCSTCHMTTGWLPATFSHAAAGATDCQGCHAQKRPANHYSGQCSACHKTTGWLPANFNHTVAKATNCQGCHAKKRPANHYSGQCSSCHTTNAWKPANFNHSGQTNCQGCHNPPAGHWSGQCSNCHTPGNWNKISVSGHTFPMNHGNAGGVCAKCHPSNSPAYTCYNCHNKAETEKKHSEEGIGDIAGRCAACHPDGKKHD